MDNHPPTIIKGIYKTGAKKVPAKTDADLHNKYVIMLNDNVSPN